MEEEDEEDVGTVGPRRAGGWQGQPKRQGERIMGGLRPLKL